MIFVPSRRVLASGLLFIVGCGSGSNLPSEADLKKLAGGKLKVVVPVSGKVTLDGSPAEDVTMYLNPGAGTGNTPPKVVRTGPAGDYCWATYRPCDGVEPGQYKLTFKKLRKRSDEDLLKGRYADPQKSEYTLTVEEGKPQKDVNFELSSH